MHAVSCEDHSKTPGAADNPAVWRWSDLLGKLGCPCSLPLSIPLGNFSVPLWRFSSTQSRGANPSFPPCPEHLPGPWKSLRDQSFLCQLLPRLQAELSGCVLHRLSPLGTLQPWCWFPCWSLMDTFKFTGSSCLKLAKGSAVKDLVAFVEGMSFRLTACEGPTGRLCDAVAAFSAISPCFAHLQVCKPSSPSSSSLPAPGPQLPLLGSDPPGVSLWLLGDETRRLEFIRKEERIQRLTPLMSVSGAPWREPVASLYPGSACYSFPWFSPASSQVGSWCFWITPCSFPGQIVLDLMEYRAMGREGIHQLEKAIAESIICFWRKVFRSWR